MGTFLINPLFLGYENLNSMRWLAYPNQGHSHHPHKFYSSFDYLIHNQSDHYHARKNGHMGPLNYVVY